MTTMNTDYGGERLPKHEASHSPFGEAGQRIGELANTVRHHWRATTTDLPFTPGTTPRWDDDDRLTFGYLLDLEASFDELARDVGERHLENRFPAVSRLRACLPFGPGQWDWIKTERNAAWHLTSDEAYGLVRRGGSFPYEELIMRRWVPRYVDGADGTSLAVRWSAMRRGIDWRVGLDVPADPAILDGAEEALDRLTAELLPSAPRP